MKCWSYLSIHTWYALALLLYGSQTNNSCEFVWMYAAAAWWAPKNTFTQMRMNYLCEQYKRRTNVCQVWMLRYDQHFMLRACVHAYILVLCWNSLINGKCMCTGDLWQRGHIYQDRLSEARRHTHWVWSKEVSKKVTERQTTIVCVYCSVRHQKCN